MIQEIKTLILYRLERAHEAIEEANVLLEKGYANTSVNRLYYACFYAVSALLLTKDLSSAKHSGVRSLFHQNFVKPGTVTIELGQFYDKLFRNRQKGDYVDFVRFNIDEVRPWYDETCKFVEIIENIVKKEISTD
jgi:uncharacterized protein (UPF0332 family)